LLNSYVTSSRKKNYQKTKSLPSITKTENATLLWIECGYWLRSTLQHLYISAFPDLRLVAAPSVDSKATALDCGRVPRHPHAISYEFIFMEDPD
jgi:hypothetical protein